VDIDPALLEQTREELERTGSTLLDLICADARDLPKLLQGKVDYALIAKTFRGVPEKTGMARAVAAVLNSRGQFAIVNWHPASRAYSGPRQAKRVED
jgi:ubiquinone/menaquinone biosynthesis C-methylase UbiE